MNKKTTLWIDVTDLMVWRGNFTGIQRVTFELCTRFYREGAAFCAFDQYAHRFIRVEWSEILSKVTSKVTPTDTAPVSRRTRLRRVIGKPYYGLPNDVKVALRPLVTTANHFARSLFARTIDRGKRFNPLHRYMDAKFLDGDIVYLIGASWNVKGMLQSLVALKVERNLRLITHINDILPIYQPQLFAEELHELFEPYVLQVIEHSSLLTVISQATKRDIEIFINQKDLPQVPIEVITLGDNPLAGKVKRPAGIAKNDEDFLFVLGTFEIRKNYQLLYQVVKLSQLEAKPIPKIIIAGRRGWLSSDLIHQIKHDPYASKQIVWLEHVSDEESAWLLNNCLFTVFPSLCEGWGLPVSESLKSGRFCLVSGVSSMLEFDEKLVDYFLPYDPRECLEKIRYYLHDRRYIHRNEEVSKNYQPVSWDDCFNEVARAVSAIKREV